MLLPCVSLHRPRKHSFLDFFFYQPWTIVTSYKHLLFTYLSGKPLKWEMGPLSGFKTHGFIRLTKSWKASESWVPPRIPVREKAQSTASCGWRLRLSLIECTQQASGSSFTASAPGQRQSFLPRSEHPNRIHMPLSHWVRTLTGTPCSLTGYPVLKRQRLISQGDCKTDLLGCTQIHSAAHRARKLEFESHNQNKT